MDNHIKHGESIGWIASCHKNLNSLLGWESIMTLQKKNSTLLADVLPPILFGFGTLNESRLGRSGPAAGAYAGGGEPYVGSP